MYHIDMKYLITFALLSWAIFSYAYEYEELILNCQGEAEWITWNEVSKTQKNLNMGKISKNYHFKIDKNYKSRPGENATQRAWVKASDLFKEYTCLVGKDHYGCNSEYSFEGDKFKYNQKDRSYGLFINRVSGEWSERISSEYSKRMSGETGESVTKLHEGHCKKGEVQF